MRRRTLAIGIVVTVALFAGTTYMGSGYFLRAQFARNSSIGYPVSVLQELCSQPADGAGMHSAVVDGPGCKYPQGGTDICWQSTGFCATENRCVAKYDGVDLPDCGTGKPGAMAYANKAPVTLGGLCHQFHCCSAGQYYGTTDDTSPGGSGNGVPAFTLPCADPDAQCIATYVGQNGMAFRCCNDPDPRVCVRQASSSSVPMSCGDGIVNGAEECDDGNTKNDDACTSACKNAKCGDDIVQKGVEDCDNGVKNVPSTIANKSWLDITPTDIAVLLRSSCLDTCKLAQCSDKKDNDKKNGTDGNDAACRDGAFGNGSKTLIGYNVEQCPMCQLDEEKDDTIAFEIPSHVWTASTIRQHQSPLGDVENLDQQYCRGGQKTIMGTECSCTSSSEVCFAEHITDDAGTIVELGSCDCKELNPPPDMQTWTWACKKDKDCSKGYRCAYYSTYKYLNGSAPDDIDIYRCRKLIDDGETVCRSRWDCKSRYKDTTKVNASGVLERDPDSRTKCIEINQGTPKCCNPDASDPSETCIRPKLGGGAAAGAIPEFAQCQTGGGANNFAGGDGGWGSGNGGGDTGDGGTDSGSSGSSRSSSSASQCNNQNPCIGVTVIGGTLAYTMPSQCPLTGNKRTCYTRCIAGINAGSAVRDCNVMCATSDTDLNMCACNPDFGDCTVSCTEEFSACSMLCAYDSNPTTCRTDCRGEYRSCLNNCGRMCPASDASSSRRSISSRASSRSSTLSSRTSSVSSGSSRFSSLGSSNKSDRSDYSQSSSSNSTHSSYSSVSSINSRRSSASSNQSASSRSFTSASQQSSDHSGSSSDSSHTSITSSSRSSISMRSSSVTSASSVSSHSSLSQSKESSSSSASSVSRSSLSSLRSSSPSSKSSSSISSSSSKSSSSTSLSSSKSSVSSISFSSSRSSIRSDSSKSSSVNGGNGGAIGGTVSAIGGHIGGTFTYSSFAGSCVSDQQCPSGTRCILGRCLAATTIAELPAFCGNARVDAGEVCDNGTENSNQPNAYCRIDCTLGRCGDGIIDTPLEQCDDGNAFNNDGCSSICQPERAAPSTILPATTIELPFTNDDPSSVIRYPLSDARNTSQTTKGQLPSVPSTPDTGPAALAVMIAGGAAGWLYRRRK